jgi:hypothetical protein
MINITFQIWPESFQVHFKNDVEAFQKREIPVMKQFRNMI